MTESILKKYINDLIYDFVNKYLYYDIVDEVNTDNLKNLFIEIVKDLILNDPNRDIKQNALKLAKMNIDNKTSYVVLNNQLAYIQNQLVHLLNKNGSYDSINSFLKKYFILDNTVSKEYLDNYLKKITTLNSMRIVSLNDMVEKQVVVYYEEHLLWLNQLIQSIENIDVKQLPEIDSSCCNFGKWLATDAKAIIKNNSKYQTLVQIHDNLHYIAALIKKQFFKENPDYNVLMDYLEKCESTSLSIGSELALIDNTIIIKQAEKDELTGVLNRNSLEMIFKNQYELSLAVNGSFVVAMTDLDNFKNINDTYGHIAGDKVLQSFTNTINTHLRNSDIVVRYGGEEFIIILPSTNYEFGFSKLDQIREAFQNTEVIFENKSIKTTVSIGFIEVSPKKLLNNDTFVIEDFINEADKNLYFAKNNGKNRVVHQVDVI